MTLLPTVASASIVARAHETFPKILSVSQCTDHQTISKLATWLHKKHTLRKRHSQDSSKNNLNSVAFPPCPFLTSMAELQAAPSTVLMTHHSCIYYSLPLKARKVLLAQSSSIDNLARLMCMFSKWYEGD